MVEALVNGDKGNRSISRSLIQYIGAEATEQVLHYETNILSTASSSVLYSAIQANFPGIDPHIHQQTARKSKDAAKFHECPAPLPTGFFLRPRWRSCMPWKGKMSFYDSIISLATSSGASTVLPRLQDIMSDHMSARAVYNASIGFWRATIEGTCSRSPKKLD